MVDKHAGHGRFVLLAGGQLDVERLALYVDDRMDFGRKTSSRAAQSIGLEPPFPPAASWCARAIDASSKLPPGSIRICSALKMRSQWPALAQLAKRL